MSLLSVCGMIQLENRWADSDEIWYGRYAVGFHPKVILSIMYACRFFQKKKEVYNSKSLSNIK